MWNIVFIITGIIFLLLLIFAFFPKPVIDSKENRLFKALIIINLVGYILEISMQLIIRGYNSANLIIIDYLSKFYLISIFCADSIFSIYTFLLCFDKIAENKNYKWLRICHFLVFIFVSIIILMLGLNKFYDGDRMYVTGNSVEALKASLAIYMFLWIVVLLINFKKLKSKKFLPVFSILILLAFNVLVQSLDPGILITSMMFTIICYTMYFTIENPDIKMIEQLNIARDAADKANQAKSEFLSSMSHEIRTPLNAIVGFSQALEEEDLPDQAKEEVEDIISASESLLEIVNGILDISKIEANKLDIINTEYSFRKVYKELINLTKARMGDSKLEFRYSMDETIPQVLYGDHARVKQVILNLLTNAVKYTKEGYLEFKVSSVVKDDICRLIISVEDSGIGIKKEALGKLFSKFERLGVEKEITIEGTGLGLAITKKLVDLMKGEIVVQSIYGQGSRFTIALDQRIVLGKDSLFEEKEEELKMIDCTGKNILVVDDNPVNLKVAKRLLDDYKANITLIGSGFEAIDDIKQGHKYDLILMDDMMPKMGGTETMKKLHEIEGFNMPVVALTANAISGMREKYINDGFDDYLPKPIQKNELNQVIDKFMGQNK